MRPAPLSVSYIRDMTLICVKKWCWALGAMLILTSCAYWKPIPPAATANTGPPSPLKGLRAEAVMEFKGAENLSGRAHILVKSPSSFRIEILGPFNTPATTISSDGTALSIFSGGTLKTYRWDEENPVLPYSFAPDELAALLLGGGPLDNAKPPEGVRPPLTAYKITRDKDGNITGVIKLKNGSAVFTVAMSDFRDAGNGVEPPEGAQPLQGVLPFSLTIDDGYKSLRIRYKSLEINPDIEPGVFNIAPDKP